MIAFNYETEFQLKDENLSEKWIEKGVLEKGF